MPSPLHYTEEIFDRLKSWGYTQKTTIQYLHKAIILETKMINPKSIKRVVKVFEQLGYISISKDSIWLIHYWNKDKPKETKEDIKKEADKLDELIE